MQQRHAVLASEMRWHSQEIVAWLGQRRLGVLSRGVRSEDAVVADMWALGPF
jgi:hypothetical protein